MPNRLVHETSPYLLQHAHNPVDWYPWGPEALERARAEDRPILLSVGYSACHWCHVMERESFEDDETAALMNARFVNVKVDREERPDLDEIYMKAVQAFTGGHGGWPMTVFLTPTGEPFFGGTYFPPQPGRGMPSFTQVLHHAHQLYHRDRARVAEITGELREYLRDSTRLPPAAADRSDGWLETFTATAAEAYDDLNAGFGGAPKFPPHGGLRVLLAHAQLTADPQARKMALETLDAMARGGMYDLLAGGFCRYSVDAEWRVPHFEKMLYDNGQLIPLYLQAWRMTGAPRYARVARESCDWILDEMTHDHGGFAASLDADTEGEEGRYYAWTPAQVREAVGMLDGLRASLLLEVSDAGTFEHGASVLRLHTPLEQLDPADQETLRRALPLLRHARSQRVAPGRDDKVIVAWNAMAIGALAQAGAALSEPRYTAAAAKAADFILSTLQPPGPDGQPRLRRTHKDGRARILAYADDHVLLIDALVDLYEATFDRRWLAEACRLADRTLALFWDADSGGLFYTGTDAEALVTRSKNFIGGAEPAANEVAALAFCRLETLCGRSDLGEKADLIVRSYQALLERAPRALGAVALAAAWRNRGSQEVALIGEVGTEAGQALLAELRQSPHPLRVVAAATAAEVADPDVLALLPWLAHRSTPAGRPTAYLCEGFACKAPTADPAELRAQLRAGQPSPEAAESAWRERRRRARVTAPALPAEAEHWLNVDAPLTLERLRGQVVVLDFWTYCCINCLHVLPELAAVEEAFAGQPVAVLGVHAAKFTAEKEADSVRRAVARHGVRHPVVLDPEHTLWEQYAIRSWPTVAVLDTRGRIAWQQPGEARREELIAVVRELIEEGRADGSLAEEPVWQVPAAAPGGGEQLRHPGKVCVYPSPIVQAAEQADPFTEPGRLYVSDTGNHRILEVRLRLGEDGWPRGEQVRVFGDGQPGLRDGPAGQARFNMPQGTARVGDTLWVADTENHAVRAVDLAEGTVRTVAGTGRRGAGIDLSPGDPRKIDLRSPWDVEAASNGSGADIVLIAMAGTHQIWILFPGDGRIGPFIGSGQESHVDGPPDEAALAQPSGMVLAGQYLFFVDSETSSIRAYQMDSRQVGTMVGQGLFDFGDVDGVGEAVRLQHPLGVTLGERELYIADTFNNKVKTLRMQDGSVSTLAGDGSIAHFAEPGGLDRAGDFLVVADTNNHRLRAVHRRTGEARDLPLA